MNSALTRTAFGGLLVLSLAACSGGSTDTDTDAGATAAASADASVAPAGGALGTVPPGGITLGVSANTASADEIAAALTAAGVDNAARWADEVIEYRPYADAAELQSKLNDELAKYNPGQETIDLIISALVP